MACFKNEQGNVEGIGGYGIVRSIQNKTTRPYASPAARQYCHLDLFLITFW